MKTLVIHPEDSTTDFLIDMYKNQNNCTIIRNGVSKAGLLNLIREHDRIWIMGHGTPNGLLAMNQFDLPSTESYIIDYQFANLLRQKNNNVYIWCYANEFVKEHQLKGFYSGMFISEMTEAKYYGIKASQKQINTSNKLFSQLVASHIDEPIMSLASNVIAAYSEFAAKNPIVQYNATKLNYI